MAVESGQNGTALAGATTIAELRNWKASTKANLVAFATNATPGYKRRVAGVKDYEGSFDVLSDPAGVLDEGTSVTLVLKKDATTTWKTIPALIGGYDINVDIDEGGPISWTVKWSGNGQPT